MMEVSCKVDRAAVANLEGILRQAEKESPRKCAAETRRAAIYICQSLRARTRKSPKAVPLSEIAKSYQTPKWIRDSHGGKPIRRMSIIRWANGENYLAQRYIYGGECVSAPRRRVVRRKDKVYDSPTVLKISPFSEAQMRKDAQKVYGQIRNCGLAKKSWGWVMKGLYDGGAGDLSWKKRRGEKRDPRKYVEGFFMQSTETKASRAEIHNKLDYILSALPPRAVDESIEAATRKLIHNIKNHIDGVFRVKRPAFGVNFERIRTS